MTTIALLPMKAHSSRVPGKNFRDLHGRPLFSWVLETLLELKFVDQIVINTDARRELKAAGLEESRRVLIRDRAQVLCGDEVSMNLILQDDVASCPADHYLMTHTTNPLLRVESLEAAWEGYLAALNDGYDSMFSVTQHQKRFYTAAAEPINHDPANLIPTQNLEPWFEENSCFYYFSPTSFAKTNARIGERPKLFELQAHEAVDIDAWADWYLAEGLLTGRGERG